MMCSHNLDRKKTTFKDYNTKTAEKIKVYNGHKIRWMYRSMVLELFIVFNHRDSTVPCHFSICQDVNLKKENIFQTTFSLKLRMIKRYRQNFYYDDCLIL
jgi:hypothetical protein